MHCDICKKQMNYCFYIDDRFWKKVVSGEKFKIGFACAHCVLEKLGGFYWHICWNEQIEKQSQQVLAEVYKQGWTDAHDKKVDKYYNKLLDKKLTHH